MQNNFFVVVFVTICFESLMHIVQYNNSLCAGQMVCANSDTPIKVMAVHYMGVAAGNADD